MMRTTPSRSPRAWGMKVLRISVLSLGLLPRVDFAADDLFELSLEELLGVDVSTASKLPRSLAQSAGIVSVYSAEEIALFGGRDLSEVLRRIPGINPILDAQNGRYRMSMRGDLPGINNNHVLILFNGIPMNRESYGGGLWSQANLSAVPLDIIQQIEVVRGPGSVLYGTNAYAGVINLITYSGKEVRNRIRLGAGDHNASAAGLLVGDSREDYDVAMALRYYATDGSKLMANSANNTFDDNLAERSPGGMLTAKKGGFHTNIWWGVADADTIRGTPAELNGGNVRNEKSFLNVGYGTLIDPQWEMKFDLSHVTGRTTLQDAIIPNGEALYKSNDSRFEFQLQGNVSDGLSVVLGSTVDYLSVRVASPQTFLPYWDNYLYGAYAQVEYLLGETRFIGGAQYNKSESVPERALPRLGLIHTFTNNTGAKLMYAQAFRAPYALEVETNIVFPAIVLSGNSELDHERVTTLDAQLFYHAEHLQASLTWFRSKQQDLILRTLTTPGPPAEVTFRNAGELKIEGLEFESKWIPTHHWFLTLSATAQKNRDGRGVDDVTLEPDYFVKLGAGYQGRHWSAGLFDVWHDAYQDNIIISPARQQLNPESDSIHYLTLNATMTMPALKDLQLGLYVDNVLDEVIYLPPNAGFTTSNINTMPSLETNRTFLLTATLPI